MAKTKKAAPKVAAIKTVPVNVDYIKEVYKEVCSEWKRRLEFKFPDLFPSFTKVGNEYEGYKTGYIYSIILVSSTGVVALFNHDKYKIVSPLIKVVNPNKITGQELVKLVENMRGKEQLEPAY